MAKQTMTLAEFEAMTPWRGTLMTAEVIMGSVTVPPGLTVTKDPRWAGWRVQTAHTGRGGLYFSRNTIEAGGLAYINAALARRAEEGP